MGHRCCSKQKVKRGLWSPEEDEKLSRHITTFGHGSWSSVPKIAGLQRCGKSCRLRWINYLRPDLKKGSFTQEEEQIIIDVHRILGNRWAQIAKHLPGRTDNEVKNFWNSCIKKKLMSQGLDPQTHNLISSQYSQRSASINAAKNNSTTTAFVVSLESHRHHDQQEPVSAFSINNNSDSIICSSSSSEDRYRRRRSENPPFQLLTLPIDPTNTNTSTGGTGGFRHYGSISPIENNNSINTNVSSSSSSSLDVQNMSCAFAADHHDLGGVMWGSSSGFDHQVITAPRSMEGYNSQESLQQGRDSNNHNIIDGDHHDHNHEKTSPSSFDLGFLETALMSDIVCNDLGSMEYDDLSWNY